MVDMSTRYEDLVAGFPEVRTVHACEVCDADSLATALDLGAYPLCDDLIPEGDSTPRREYPQVIALCEHCLTAHQVFQVRKELLFPSSYHYRSRLTKDVTDGMANLVADTLGAYPPGDGARVLDIGCNDGSLLAIFKQEGLTAVGVDPTDAVLEAPPELDAAHREFFTVETAQHLYERWGTFDYITMTNVFAHIEDLPQLIRGLRLLMGPETVLVIENHYLGSILSGSQFDTFYHEHPRTYSARSFEFIARQLETEVASVTRPSRYGGNIRVTMTRRRGHGGDFEIGDESHFVGDLANLQDTFGHWRDASSEQLGLMAANQPLLGKALPGRAVMLINSLGLNSDLMPAVHEQPGSPKVGFRVPNTMNEVRSDADLAAAPVGDLVIWAWHIADEVLVYLRELGYRGRVWTPLPRLTLLATL